jgi:hypothetical protein
VNGRHSKLEYDTFCQRSGNKRYQWGNQDRVRFAKEQISQGQHRGMLPLYPIDHSLPGKRKCQHSERQRGDERFDIDCTRLPPHLCQFALVLDLFSSLTSFARTSRSKTYSGMVAELEITARRRRKQNKQTQPPKTIYACRHHDTQNDGR